MPSAALHTAEITAFSRETECPPRMRTRRLNRPLQILLVEDCASDTILTEIALDATAIDYDLQRLDNGSAVLPYLLGSGTYTRRKRPDLMLLDLTLPCKDGFEVLADMASHTDSVRNLPTIILTGDRHSAFLRCSYGLNIVAYIMKPCSDEKLLDAFARITAS
jgi:chemotaxis family two-component system response regulator Rcp1